MELLALGLLGGFLALDGTAVGQFMLSRPIVAGALAGWLIGAPDAGIALGAVLELYLLVSIPAGGARFPESSVATVVTVGIAGALEGTGAVPLALAFGLVWGQLAGMSVTAQRHLNARLVPEAGTPTEDRSPSLAHLGAIAADLTRATLVTLTGVWLGRLLLRHFVDGWPLDEPSSRAIVLIGGVVSAGILLHDVQVGGRRGAWFVVGVVLALGGGLIL